jgi:hypothetical protein
MNKQPEALRLADALANYTGVTLAQMDQAAAELRRLHGLDFALRDCELALQKMATKYMDAVDQRDALLEVLQWFMPFIESEQDDERQAPWVEKARAAIAKATGEKT